MDDLLDLDWSKGSEQRQDGSGGATGKPQSISSVEARSGAGPKSSYNFDALTKSMPTAPTAIRSQPSKVPTATGSSTAGADAFSSLLGFGGTPPSGNMVNSTTMSMADRLKQNSQAPVTAPSSVTVSSQPSAWDGLEDFIGGSSARPSKPAKVAPTNVQSTNARREPSEDLWGFDSPKEARQTLKAAVPKQAAAGAFDFSEFEDPGASQSSALGGGADLAPSRARPNPPKAAASVQAFDDEEDEDGDDSVLGSLGRPKRSLASALHAEQRRNEPQVPIKPAARNGIPSPPPHIIGQVVEMGFSPIQARQALSATSTGQDVAAAIEMLLGSARAEASRRRPDEREEDEERDRRYAMRVQQEEQARKRPGSGDGAAWDNGRTSASASGSRSETPTDWQKQADQLYAQASEIGATVFSRANALWATAKTQAQKALDEHNMGTTGSSSNASSGRSSPATGSDRARSRRWAVPTRDGGARREWQGKPKWMLEAEDAEEPAKEEDKGNRFRDGQQDGVAAVERFEDDEDVRAVRSAPVFVDKVRAQEPQRRQAKAETDKPSADLWVDDGDTTKAAGLRAPVIDRPGNAASKAATRASPVATPSPKPSATKTSVSARRPRPLVQDDASAVHASAQHRQRGNELFKRGAYGEAETAYTSALGALDANPRSLRRIAVLNNRANARIKNGDAKGALDDTMAVLRIIVVQEGERSSPFLLYKPSNEAPLPLPEYAEVNLREGYAKALLRRAQAEEQLERWDPALSVWSLLEKYEREEGSGTNGVTNMRAAQDGKGRCNKMLKGGLEMTDKGAPVQAVVNPRVRAAAARAVAKAEAQAKERIRTENAAMAAEEAKKDNLRDSVDARVLSWKAGKENNVRALLASLHDVVWPGLAWKRVGMHELVMDNQVKKVYMRAIGKLHPDKLTPRNNSVEERMIGGAVFSVLNEAYAAAGAS